MRSEKFMAKKLLLLLIIPFLFFVSCPTESPESGSNLGPKDGLSGQTVSEYFAAKGLYVGWNLGNALDAPNGEGTWSPAIVPEIFAGVKAAGFNLVRIPITWRSMLGAAPDYTIDAARLQRVAEVVDMAYDAGLAAIINIHHDGSSYGGWLNVRSARDDETSRAEITGQFRKVWGQIAERFKDYGDWLIFEPFNELHNGGWGSPGTVSNPVEFDILNEWNQVFTDVVRQSGGNNAERFLVVQPYSAKPNQALADTFELPTDTAENKQIVSIHYYDPEAFALNGSNPNWGTANHLLMTSTFRSFSNKFTSKGIPVIMGECGATYQNRQDDQVETAKANRIAYLSFLCSEGKKYGLIPIYWDNGTITADSVGENFGLFDRTTGLPLNDHSRECIGAMVNAVK
jgi:endoglucanase